ncbi:MAG: SagB/ThcOx family dehydrogenase [Candidatus Rokubacteria bacterium]|nr:SagB/ThcOx family dehydrogenase [Candidatus Rokubacteria bacterium]
MSQSGNRDTRVARDYHDRTAHSRWSVRQSGHSLDWETKPFLYKVYPDLPVVQLPRELPSLAADALEALGGPRGSMGTVTLEELAALLFFAAGITKKKTYPGGEEMHFRAAASTGALYQTEVYVVAAAVADLAAGVYHFCPGDFALRRLREGDFRQEVGASAADPAIARAPAALVLTAIYWRNTWKYQARAYRHLFWDSGAMLANLLAAASGLALPARLVAGFVDSRVNLLLGLDPEKEASLELVPVGPDGAEAPPAQPAEPIGPRTLPLSTSEVDYPLLRAMHTASALADPEEVARWRGGAGLSSPDPPPDLLPLPAPKGGLGRGLAETIVRRASTRQFAHVPITAEELSTVLFHATRGFPADFPAGLVHLYLIVNAVDGVPAGAYCYWPAPHGLELLKAGEFRSQAGYLCLEQALGADASCVIFFLADLASLLDRYGNRGYRLANLEAGLVGGRCYLGAYGLGFGASGLTFYDGEVVSFFSPHAAGKDAIFVTALGRSVKAAPRTRVSVQLGRS